MESELLLLHLLTLRTQQLTLFGCKSWGFVIYNQFSALVSPALTCPFFAVCTLPRRRSKHSSVASVQSLSPSPPFSVSLCLRPPPHPSLHLPLYMHCRGPRQVCPSCASSGNCLPWYIMREPPEHRPMRSRSSHNRHTSVQHMMLNTIDLLNESTTQRAFKQPLPTA